MKHIEIFQEMAKCQIQGMMFHNNMADYYVFLKCCNMKKKHECEMAHDMESLRCIKDYYIKTYEKVLHTNHGNLSVDEIIPSNWDEYELTKEQRVEYLKNGLKKYYEYETIVKEKTEELLNELFNQEYYDDYKEFKFLLDDVIVELSHIRDFQIAAEQKNYDIDAENGLCYKL